MGCAVSLKNSDSREQTRALPFARGPERDPVANSSPARTRSPGHESTANRAVNQGEILQMVPLAHRGSPPASSIPSSISSLEHASPMVTPSPVRGMRRGSAPQCSQRPSNGNLKSRVDSTSAKSRIAEATPPTIVDGDGAQPSSSVRDVGDDVPRIEEMAVMATALMRPYHTICRRVGRGNRDRTCATSLASRVVDRLARGEVGDDDSEDDPLAATPGMQAFLFLNPPTDASEAVAASYPARWYPFITPCFDGGLLFRIEWKRRGKKKLAGETDGYACVVWCFHNTTACYEMEIEVMFKVPTECSRAAAPLRGWGETTLSWVEEAASGASPTTVARNPCLTARATCPPLSTIGFIMGRVGAYRTSIRGVPVSQGPPKTLTSSNSDTKLDEIHPLLSSEEALRAALKEWRHFVDPEFPSNTRSLLGGGPNTALSPLAGSTASPTAVSWQRAADVVARLVGPSCVLLTQMHEPLDPIIDPLCIEPGELGDSWLVGAMAAVAEHPVILLRMFRHPKSSEHAKIERAIGAIRVTLNVQGWWHSILVDDFLPVTGGGYQKYAHSRRDMRELWIGLLEKAFAKVRGGYANIVAGDPLDALRTFTGWPCARYDITNFKDIAVASSAFASRLLRYDQHGLQIIFHTAPQPYSASADRNGGGGGLGGGGSASLTEPSLSLDEDGAGAGGGGGDGGNGLVPGMVYAVLQILQFSTNPFRAELTLLQVRNIWGDVAAWKGKWRCGSPRWAQCPKVAEACHMPIHPTHALKREGEEEKSEGAMAARGGEAAGSDGAALSECTCRREKYIWLEWNEVYRYFSGCGVLFRLALHYDYRVQGIFDGVQPSVCLRITVTSRSFVGVTLSMQDTGDVTPRMDDGGVASAHPPIMVTLAREQAGTLRVVRNSQMDPDNPTPLFTFMQVSDASLLSLLTPEDSPYWVIPRMLVTSANASSTDVDAPPAANHPYVLGYLQKDPVGVKDGPRVEFVRLPASSPAFQNSTCFSLGDEVQSVSAKFQVKSPQAGFPNTYIHTEVSEEAGTPANDDFNAADACG